MDVSLCVLGEGLGCNSVPWRAEDSAGQSVVSGGLQVQVEVSDGFDGPLEGECQPPHGDVAVAGKCTLKVRNRYVRGVADGVLGRGQG